MNEVSIIINGVRYDAVKGLQCHECVFDESCDMNVAELCYIVGVDGGFKKSEESLKYERRN
jgi:hypothetical protein